ncbi:MAG: pantoate--beta-alanine ligase [Kiritimatiellae bacterium]|nr:pantoate--beta-alanine ligase [Kiritimatiellia bacterium]
MKTIATPAGMQAWSRDRQADGKRIACVPTMGFLHDGHLSLVRRARELADGVVLTLFVNPTQFGPGEDFAAYPRDAARDLDLCRRHGVDAVFMPADESMYLPDHSIYIAEESLSGTLCGASRPGHFRGVCTVVAKLFNCVLPQVAVFGQKDAQQIAIIRRMVRDLNFPVEIAVAPTVREPDGLAMSSRNARLDADSRKSALGLSRALREAACAYAAGTRDSAAVLAQMRTTMERAGLRVDYAAAVDALTLKPVAALADGVLLAVAAFAGGVRLIDNQVL